jgi:hypothetical protein
MVIVAGNVGTVGTNPGAIGCGFLPEPGDAALELLDGFQRQRFRIFDQEWAAGFFSLARLR